MDRSAPGGFGEDTEGVGDALIRMLSLSADSYASTCLDGVQRLKNGWDQRPQGLDAIGRRFQSDNSESRRDLLLLI